MPWTMEEIKRNPQNKHHVFMESKPTQEVYSACGLGARAVRQQKKKGIIIWGQEYSEGNSINSSFDALSLDGRV